MNPPTEAEGIDIFISELSKLIIGGSLTNQAIRSQIIYILSNGPHTLSAIQNVVSMRFPLWKKA